MSDKNKQNILYFESSSMRGLYKNMQTWQTKGKKRFLSISVQKDVDVFCCIALTNPSEVVITNGIGKDQAKVVNGHLLVGIG